MRRVPLVARRRAVQVCVALVMALVPALNEHGVNVLSGNFLAFNLAGLPLADPLAALQSGLASLDVLTPAGLGGGIALVLAGCLGPVFCSWGCPYGLLSELVAGLGRSGRKRAGLVAAPGPRGFRVKAALAATALGLIVALGWPPLLNQLSMPGWYSRFFQLWTFQSFQLALTPVVLLPVLLLAPLAIEAVLGRRLWCRYLCPQSVLLALARKANPLALRVGFAPRRCSCSRGGEACREACTLGLEPRRDKGLVLECSNCGDCVEACRDRGGALRFVIGAREGGSPDNSHAWRRSVQSRPASVSPPNRKR